MDFYKPKKYRNALFYLKRKSIYLKFYTNINDQGK